MDPGWAWCSDTALWLSQREISGSQTTALQMEIYTHHADSRHSWLEVPIQQLITLGIAHEISPYSYTDGTHAYLRSHLAKWSHVQKHFVSESQNGSG